MSNITIKDFPNYSINIETAEIFNIKNEKLKPYNTGKGYLQVKLSNKGKTYPILIHHLVFCAKRKLKILLFKKRIFERGQNIHHKDSNPKNNTYSNLELVSFIENHYLRKKDFPFPLIYKQHNRFVFQFQSNHKRINKSNINLDYIIRFRNRYLSLYYNDTYKEVIRIEKKYKRQIKSYYTLNKHSKYSYI